MVIDVLVVGYGKVGQDMVTYLTGCPYLQIKGVVEPGKNMALARQTEIPAYNKMETALEKARPEVIIDCATAGQGAKNLLIYKRHKIPAIVQGGEKKDVAPLYVPAGEAGERYVRLPKCSATITNWLLQGLYNNCIIPEYLEATYYKVMSEVPEGKGWWEPNYISGKEVEETWQVLVGRHLEVRQVSSRYLPGKAHHRPIYSGDMLLGLSTPVSCNDIIAALAKSGYIFLVDSKEIETMPYLDRNIPPSSYKGYEIPLQHQRIPLIPIVDKKSIRKLSKRAIKLHIEAAAPSIDLPLNIMASIDLTKKDA